jgi:hypothetical protein
MLPAAAHAEAAAAATIYVKNATGCSDSGTGTQGAPFCTLQAGIDAAVPGDTVDVLGGGYRPVTVTRSGTATQPINIVATTTAKILPVAGSTATAFTFANVSYVSVSNFLVVSPATRYAYVAGSNHITIDRFYGQTYKPSSTVSYTAPGIEVAGNSSAVTLSRNQFDDYYRQAPSIQIDAGSADDVITTNYVRDGSILATDAPGTAVTSNTLNGTFEDVAPATGITLAGASTGSYIENNAVEPNWNDTAIPAVEVDSAAAAGTTVDYNTIDLPTDGYEWAGTFYASPTAFHAATGQGSHDLDADPAYQSTLVNNANSAAPGELATDFNGNPRIDDPLYPETGAGPYAYYDRGDTQIQPPTTNADTITTTADGALGVTAASQNWSSAGYMFNFGDGTGTVNGAYGTATHTYAHSGTYTITVTGTSSASGQPFTDTTTFTTTALGSGNFFDTERDSSGRWWGGWQQGPANSTGIAQAAVTAMPNGDTQAVAVTTSGVLEHTVNSGSNGDWQNWGMPKNNATAVSASLAGMPDGSTQIIEVTSKGALEHTIRYANGSWQTTGWGSPAGSTGIAQAAITAMPNGSTQLVAVTTSGTLEHNIRNANGTWQTGGWGDPTQTDLAAAATSPSIAGLPNGSAQIIEISAN